MSNETNGVDASRLEVEEVDEIDEKNNFDFYLGVVILNENEEKNKIDTTKGKIISSREIFDSIARDNKQIHVRSGKSEIDKSKESKEKPKTAKRKTKKKESTEIKDSADKTSSKTVNSGSEKPKMRREDR